MAHSSNFWREHPLWSASPTLSHSPAWPSVFAGITSHINCLHLNPCLSRLQTSGTLFLLPFSLLDKGFIPVNILAISPHTPVVVLGNNPTRETTESETLAFVHISLSLSLYESRQWPRLPPPTPLTQEAPSRGTLTSLHPLCPFSELFEQISRSFILSVLYSWFVFRLQELKSLPCRSSPFGACPSI